MRLDFASIIICNYASMQRNAISTSKSYLKKNIINELLLNYKVSKVMNFQVHSKLMN